MNLNEGNVFTLQTVQIGPFRTAITALKDILLETNITFSADGMRIINMDKSHTILVHMFLPAENFEFYECKKEKIIIGVNMFHFFKFITSIDNGDILTMYIENGDYCDGIVSHLALKYENGEIKQCKVQKLKLIEPEQDEIDAPNVRFSSIMNLPSCDFQKFVRDLSYLSDRVEIKSIGNQIIFKCQGQIGSAEIVRAEADGSMTFILRQDASKVIQGVFSLKNLGYFIKCTPLCSHLEIYLENDLPLVVKYAVASLGSIRLATIPLPSCL